MKLGVLIFSISWLLASCSPRNVNPVSIEPAPISKTVTSSKWYLESYLKAPNAGNGDNFGWASAISDGTVVVGAPNEDNAQTTITNGPTVDTDTGTATDSGAAYVFKRTGDSWVQEAYLKAPNTFAGNRFANTVAISGDTIVIGSAFESSSQATITNGPTASANRSLSSSGAAYVFKRTGTTWTQEAYLKAPNPDSGDMFGANYYQGVVAISGDTIVAGAWNESNSQTTITNGTFAGADLGTAANSGAAYVFKRTGNTWANEAYLKAPNAGAGDRFGKSVGISGDTIVVGAWNEGNSQTTISNGTFTGPDVGTAATSGAAYVFKRTGNTWANEAYLKAPNNSPGIFFSWGLTISGDTIVVGANGESSSQTSITNGATANFDDSLYKSGAAYVFRRYGTTWTNEAYLKAPNAYMNTFFGDRVNLAGDTLVVGHFGDVSSQSTITHGPTAGMDRTLVDAGGVHVFKRTGTTWSYEAYLKPPNPDKDDWFGYSVGISGDSIVVGVANEDSSQNNITSGDSFSDNNDLSNSGAVFVFRRNPKEGLTPLITDLSPRSFPLSGGGQMVIQGSGFQKGATVTISGTPCENVFYQDYSELQCTIPPGSFAGPNSIVVTNPSGATTSDSTLFSYIGDPNALMSSGNSNTSIHLSWNPAGGSTRAYQVAYQSGNSAPTTCSNGTVIDESTVGAATSYTVSGLTANTRYSFRVCAVDASGVLGSGITSSSFPQAPDPTSLAAAGSSTTQIALSWASGGTGTNQYQIAYQTGATAPADCFSGTVTKASTQGSTTTRTIGSLTAGTQYSFRVCATNADGFLSPGVTVSAYPSAPAVTGLTTVGASTTSITLNWTSGGVGTNQYQIAYQTGSSAPANCSSGTTVSASTVGSATSYTVSSLSAGTTYAFRVCATNTDGTFSTSVTAVGYPLAPNPSNFSVTASSTTAVNLSWTSGGTGTSKYQIAYQSGATAPSDCSSGSVIPFSIVNTSTSFAVFGLTAGTNYSFRVCSTNSGNNLNSGVTVSGSPSSDGGSDISTFTSAGESSTSIGLTWTSPSAASYQLAYRSGSTPPTSCASATGITTLDVGAVNSYSVNSLTAGTQYSFRVCVRTSPGVFSAGATARSYPRAPEPNLSSTVGTSANQIKLTWTSGGTGTNQYQIAYQTGAVAPPSCSAGTVIAASTVNNSLNYTIGSLIEGSQYSFRLCSTNLDGTLSTGVSSSAYPLATNVTSLTATGTSTSQIQLGWASGGLGASQYQIAYKTGGTAPANCTTDTVISSGVVTNLTTYTVTGLSAGTQYAFRVCATNTDGTLSTGTTVTGYPAAPEPTGLTALPSYAGNIRLSWSSGGAGTNQYQIAFQSGAEAPADCTTGTILTASTVKNATTYDVGLSGGSNLFLLFSRTLYSFRVCATNSSGKLTSGITVSAYPPDNNLVGSILISEGTEYTSNPLVTLTLAALGGDQMYVTTTVGCLTGGTWEPFNSSKLWTLTTLNGINRLYVKYLDSAGNQSPCYGDSIVHDDTPPVTPVLSINGGASSTNSVLVDLGITATDLPAEMYVTNSPGCVDGGTWENFSSAKTAWVLNQMNSAASVFVKTRDMALNESVCATATINHDNQAPTLSSISITPVSPSSSATPTVQFNLSESATVTLYNGGSCSTAISANASKTIGEQSVISNSLSQGLYQIYIRAMDLAGNLSPCTEVATQYLVDLTPPNPSNFTAVADHSSQITLSWTGGGGSTVSYQVAYQTGTSAPINCSAGQIIPSSSIAGSTSIAVTGLTTEDYVFRVCAMNSSGIASSGVTTTGTTGWYQEAYIKAPNAGANDQFGYKVSISGDTLVVGASGESSNQTTITNGTTASTNDSANGAGAAYVFKRNGSTWAAEAYLKAPNAETADSFGISVSISGDTIVVGASYEDSSETTITNGSLASINNSLSSSGAAYVFRRTGSTWANEAYLKAPNTGDSDRFGNAVSVSGDTIVVGSFGEDNGQTDIYNGTFSESDSSTATDSGAAYVFKRTGSTWTNEAYLKAPNAGSDDYFGAYAIKISGDTLVVGAHYEDNSQTTIFNGTFNGADVSYADRAGAAYVFKRTGSTWTNEAYLKAPNAGTDDRFGWTLGISGDTIVVGTRYEDNGQTTIYNGTFSESDSSTAADSGAAYVFKRAGSTWTNEAYLKAPNSEASDSFGQSVGISGDTIVVGAWGEDNSQTTINNNSLAITETSQTNESGAAYVFKRSGSVWANEAYLKAPNAGLNDQFGINTDVSGDTIVVGAHLEDSNQTTITNGNMVIDENSAPSSGAVYVFRRAETLATPVVTSVTPNTGATAEMNVVIFGSGFRKDATVKVGGTACTSLTVQGPNEIICTLPVQSAGAQAIEVTQPNGVKSNTTVTITY